MFDKRGRHVFDATLSRREHIDKSPEIYLLNQRDKFCSIGASLPRDLLKDQKIVSKLTPTGG
jgi:hypothetical protein